MNIKKVHLLNPINALWFRCMPFAFSTFQLLTNYSVATTSSNKNDVSSPELLPSYLNAM